MNDKTKRAIIMGSILGVGILGIYLMWKKIRKDKFLREMGDVDKILDDSRGNSEDESLDPSGSGQTGELGLDQEQLRPNFQPDLYAETLLEAMQGVATNEEAIFSTLADLSHDERLYVKDYFDTILYPSYTLTQWLKYDLTNTEERIAFAFMEGDDEKGYRIAQENGYEDYFWSGIPEMYKI